MPTPLRLIEASPTPSSAKVVDPLDLLNLWPGIEPLVIRAIRRTGGDYRYQDVFNFLHTGKWQLIAAKRDRIVSIVILSVENYPLRRVCLVRYAAGELGAIMANLDLLDMWAKAQGCQSLKCYGRQGWARKLGWKLKHVVLEKDL